MAVRHTVNLLGAFAIAGAGALYSPHAQADNESECRPYREGRASWYGPGFVGGRMANGERFDPSALTTAHRSLPFGTVLEVRFNERSVRVVVSDRGPYVHGRLVDLSRAAAENLGMREQGVARVTIFRCREVLPIPPIPPDIPYQELAQAPE